MGEPTLHDMRRAAMWQAAIAANAPMWTLLSAQQQAAVISRIEWALLTPDNGDRLPGMTYCAGRSAVAHDRTPMIDGFCPVCGERDITRGLPDA